MFIFISIPIWKELMWALRDCFNVRDYFDRWSTQSETILKFQYIKGLLWLHITHSSTKITITQISNMPCRSYIYFFIKCVAVGGCTLWLCVAKATHSFPKVFNFFFLKYTIISRHFSLACKTNKCNTFYFIFFTKCITFVLFYKLLKLTLLL